MRYRSLKLVPANKYLFDTVDTDGLELEHHKIGSYSAE